MDAGLAVTGCVCPGPYSASCTLTIIFQRHRFLYLQRFFLSGPERKVSWPKQQVIYYAGSSSQLHWTCSIIIIIGIVCLVTLTHLVQETNSLEKTNAGKC